MTFTESFFFKISSNSHLLSVWSIKVPRLKRLISQLIRSMHFSLSSTLRAKLDIFPPISLMSIPKPLPCGIVMTGIGTNRRSNGRRRIAGIMRNKNGMIPSFKSPRIPRPLRPLIPRRPPNPPSPPRRPPAPPSKSYPGKSQKMKI